MKFLSIKAIFLTLTVLVLLLDSQTTDSAQKVKITFDDYHGYNGTVKYINTGSIVLVTSSWIPSITSSETHIYVQTRMNFIFEKIFVKGKICGYKK